VIHYNWTEQRPTYLIWGLLLTTIINIMIWNETFLINTYIFGGCGWRWWQDIDDPILPYLTMDVIFHIWQSMTYSIFDNRWHIPYLTIDDIFPYFTDEDLYNDVSNSLSTNSRYCDQCQLWRGVIVMSYYLFLYFLLNCILERFLAHIYLLFFEILLIHVTYI